MKILTVILFSIILFGMIPLSYGLAHPEPGIYIVNNVNAIPAGSGTNVGEQFQMTWGIENRGNVVLGNITTFGTLDPGVTYVSSNTADCTYDDSIRKITCVGPVSLAPNLGLILYDHILTADVAGIWVNTGVVCGDFDNTQICDPDQSFVNIVAITPPPPIIQDVNVTALNQRIIDLETLVAQLQLRITTLELVPDPEPVDITALENRVNTLEQAWISFQTAWKNVFG